MERFRAYPKEGKQSGGWVRKSLDLLPGLGPGGSVSESRSKERKKCLTRCSALIHERSVAAEHSESMRSYPASHSLTLVGVPGIRSESYLLRSDESGLHRIACKV